MSKLQTIQTRLKEINGACFQELCDCYLMRCISNYTGFSRTGSQLGKQKTKKGTPDSYFLLPNGNFIYIEYTTDISTKNKLENDIRSCFDSKKTKISIEKIEEIILCFNWNIEQKKMDELNILAKSFKNNIQVRYISLDYLAIQLMREHRDLVRDYLDLPLDTGQIVSVENFIKEYERASQAIATPLNNKFLHRKAELQQLINSINGNDLIIIKGAAGVGKTKLALETIQEYVKENKTYQAYCISYKSCTLFDELQQYITSEKDYLLFVDDANRIDEFTQIIGFLKLNRKGNLKVILTVRDYAFKNVVNKCQEFKIDTITLNKLSDEQIIDVIKSEPFNILNFHYYQQIVAIANGNPRLAIMLARLVIEHKQINVLYNVFDLFEKYFTTFIKDHELFTDKLTIKCLGIIAFFNAIPYKNKFILNSILSKFDISSDDFIHKIDALDKLELVDIEFEHVKISEQNLANFLFYKAFIENDYLSFQTLLANYFNDYYDRFEDNIIPIQNNFGVNRIKKKITPLLAEYWENNKSFEFLTLFWLYLPADTLEFIYELICSLPDEKVIEYNISNLDDSFNYNKDKVIELLGDIFYVNSEYLTDAIELSFEYVKKKPEKLSELIKKIRTTFIFGEEDEICEFKRQRILFDILIKGVNNNDNLSSILFHELTKTFLVSTFHKVKHYGGNSLIHYQYNIPNNDVIKIFRSNIWNALINNFSNKDINVLELLKDYSKNNLTNYKDIIIVEFDAPFILDIINLKLNPEDFEHCKYVHNQINFFKNKKLECCNFNKLVNKFINDTYEIYLKLKWDRKFCYSEYKTIKENDIKSSFTFTNYQEIENFYKHFELIVKSSRNPYYYNRILDFIIDYHFVIDKELSLSFLKIIMSNNNRINYIPHLLFEKALGSKDLSSIIWELIKQFNFQSKEYWEMSFFYGIKDNFINEELCKLLIETINNVNNIDYIRFSKLEKFLRVDRNLFNKILKIIILKDFSKMGDLYSQIDLFEKYICYFNNDIELIKRFYIKINSINQHFDFNGRGMLNLLMLDKNFLIELVESLYCTRESSVHGSECSMGYVWNIEGIGSYISNIFKFFTKKNDFFGILKHYCNVFFKDLNNEQKIISNEFIRKYVVENNLDYKKMNIIFDILKNSRKELFEEILLLFISLNQDVGVFSKILWIENGKFYSDDVIIGNVKASKWRELLSIVNRSPLGYKLIPIKRYIEKEIQDCLSQGEIEKKIKFLRNK